MSDFIIIGAGVIGLSIAKALKEKYPNSKIVILEKEKNVGYHSSGRNSGVLHAGFYYTANSLKAKFTRDGCLEMSKFCEDNGLSINRCKKIVVANNQDELEGLEELYRRGVANGVEIELIDEEELNRLYPNITTYKKALFSPNTATIDPIEILEFLKNKLIQKGVEFRFSEGYNTNLNNNTILTTKKIN